MAELTARESAALIAEVEAQLTRDHGACMQFETHISHVLLAGDNAYKFKKPVNLGFLDFSTLALRRNYCEREVALNHRYAPGLYLGVLPLVRRARDLAFDTTGTLLDYVVWMRRFGAGERLDELLELRAVDEIVFTGLGKSIGQMHLHAPHPLNASQYGSATLSSAQMVEGLQLLDDSSPNSPALLERYRNMVTANTELLTERHRQGFIRDCHGDLHLANIVRLDGRLVPFDCIEFNDELRFIDTMSDFAFLIMDLDLRRADEFSNVLLNAYLAACGDYAGLGLLRLYCAYRSIVRAKVAVLSSTSINEAARVQALNRCVAHLTLAQGYLAPPAVPRLLITHGVSGSGKSWRSQRLARRGYIHLRSDIERRRLAGIELDAPSGSALDAGIYGTQQSETTYQRLQSLAGVVLRAGYSVIVDATFLKAAQRAAFRAFAHQQGIRFGILACDCADEVLRARIADRHAAGGDPSEATEEVLKRQRAICEPLVAEEQLEVIDEALGG